MIKVTWYFKKMFTTLELTPTTGSDYKIIVVMK
jgi:hypothetical protein